MSWRSRDVLRVTMLVAGVWVGLQLFWLARSVFVLGFLGVLFGVALAAGVDWLEQRKIPRGAGALLLLVLVIGAFVGLGLLIAPRITEQVQELQGQLPDALGRVESWVRERSGGGANLQRTLTQQVSRAGIGFFTLFSGTLAALGGLLVITFVAVYIAVDPTTYRRGVMHLVPHRGRPKAGEIMSAMGVMLRRWLVAQLVGMLVIGIITTVAMLLIGVRAAVALGIIAGILEFVPYFGPIISAVPAIAMGFLDGPERALWVVVAYIAIQQIEGNLLMPYLMKEGLELPPVITILGQAVMALIFGFVGLLIAMPLLGVLMVPIKLLYVQDAVGDEVELPGTAL